jgi:hypothetical protein
MNVIYTKDDIRQANVFKCEDPDAGPFWGRPCKVRPGRTAKNKTSDDQFDIPDIEVRFEIGHSDNSFGLVIFKLYDIGDEDDRAFDCDIHSQNNDNWGIRQAQSAINVAVEEFYRQGYNRRFGRIIGE